LVASLIAAGIAAALLLGLLAARSSAAKGGGQATAGFSLSSEYVWNNPNPSAPAWCLNEDDNHTRTWTGTLSGAFSATEKLCDRNVDFSGDIWWTAGGIGIQSDLYVVGELSDLVITSPLGDSHSAVFMGSSTVKRVTTDHYQVCYVPPFSVTYNVGGMPLPGGTWQIALSGTFKSAKWIERATMTDAPFQQQWCPAPDQNLVP
jgi:hypothetical protein